MLPDFVRLTFGNLGAVAAALALAGCVTPMTSFSLPASETADAAPCRAVCYWDRNVRLAFDSVNGGTAIPGLAGRVYLLGEDKLPITARGRVVVEWFDPTATGATAKEALGRVEYTSDKLQTMRKKDPLGVGYTLFLPWPTYRPDVTRVRIHLSFFPEKGGFPLYADPTLVSLECDQPITSRQHIVPANGLLPLPEAKK